MPATTGVIVITRTFLNLLGTTALYRITAADIGGKKVTTLVFRDALGVQQGVTANGDDTFIFDRPIAGAGDAVYSIEAKAQFYSTVKYGLTIPEQGFGVSSGGGGTLDVQYDEVDVVAAATTLDFAGAATVTDMGSGVAKVFIGAGSVVIVTAALSEGGVEDGFVDGMGAMALIVAVTADVANRLQLWGSAADRTAALPPILDTTFGALTQRFLINFANDEGTVTNKVYYRVTRSSGGGFDYTSTGLATTTHLHDVTTDGAGTTMPYATDI